MGIHIPICYPPKVYLNLLLTETLSKLISKINRGDITTGIPNVGGDVILKPHNRTRE